MRHLISSAALAALVAACGPIGPDGRRIVDLETPYDPAAFAPFDRIGTASITGTARITGPAGEPVTCDGSPVRLIADTPLTRELVRKVVIEGRRVRPVSNDPNAVPSALHPNAFRRTRCSPDGSFAFEGVASGRWIVFTEAVLFTPDGPVGGTLGAFFEIPADLPPDLPMTMILDEANSWGF